MKVRQPVIESQTGRLSKNEDDLVQRPDRNRSIERFANNSLGRGANVTAMRSILLDAVAPEDAPGWIRAFELAQSLLDIGHPEFRQVHILMNEHQQIASGLVNACVVCAGRRAEDGHAEDLMRMI